MAKAKPKLSDITPQEVERFWGYVDRRGPDECWPWIGYAVRRYGTFTFQTWTFRTHRIAYFLGYNADPADLCVCHRCDNPPCCNPAHLFLGTNVDNTHDRDAKGRVSRGPEHMAHIPLERLAHGRTHHNAKMDEATTAQLRREYERGNISQTQLAEKYGLGQSTVSQIVRRATWRHVD